MAEISFRTKLRQGLVDCFSEEELHTLCFDMGLDYESLPAQGKTGKAREIVAHFERINSISSLVEQCRRLRPNGPWDESRVPAKGAERSVTIIPKLWLWAGAGIIGVVLLALLIPRILPGALLPTAVLPTATLVPPTITSAPPTATSRPPTATPVPPTITPGPPLGVATTQISDKDSMIMVYVPAGEFTMGSADGDSDADSDEKQHKVYLDAFWIDRTEVTNGQYRKCVEAGACRPPSQSESSKRSSYYGNAQYDNYPVIYVSWYAAEKYCQWAGRRLPTEAEWEKAARGTDGRKYPWGNEAPDDTRLNYNQYVGHTSAVGSYPSGASPYGALDMLGNVWEWVADWYDGRYYASSPALNPMGPTSGQYRVLRGGSWVFFPKIVRAALRHSRNPEGRYDNAGFRCASSS